MRAISIAFTIVGFGICGESLELACLSWVIAAGIALIEDFYS